MTYSVKAYNTATASANKMHDDAVARGLGFRGGLVPGTDVYAYLCHVPAERWGEAWLQRGTMHARFISPVYDGDVVAIEHDDTGGAMTVDLFGPDGAKCATATATLPDRAEAPPAPSQWPSGKVPDHRPPASPESFSVPFGQIEATFRGDRAAEYLDDVRDELALFRSGELAHPGWLLRYANWVLTANVELGPWIHVESVVRFFAPVRNSDVVETRAKVSDVYERQGHRFVDLDVLQVVRDAAVTRTAHTAIYQPRGT
ncbi:MAG TPA: hypothetical protein VNB24_05535 [Acidimicrobiales bacterium]|nr:hypothetical protein [Acidimicrobiales bacterium]